ncbi:sigma-70 family RNA polymerase sigma factor [Actinoallomurus bryophytorum]|uniref:RNA polymerase sigma-70 factor (ECF subfamily) n=1 Tax=Actinoallomurus bryophytorum TaxID=1490222 RepID=A0A543CH70_9ACTN|nr:sigma-70 family RNA polymerase sigma factor [Actinoallomurus bryophytorum]TQL96428.1 RNA polymerase sigma-70 factor (ECF subfamily) [Actinoallomurus bryophytorum]
MSSLVFERELPPASPAAPICAARAVPRLTGRMRVGGAGRPPRVHHGLAPAPAADPQALLRTLYADHAKALRAYVTRLLSDPYHAEDIVQETMLRAWRNAEILVPERGSVRGWLMRVAHNIAVDKIRARMARPDEVEESAAAPRSFGDHSSAVVDSVFLARALAQLSPAHREVLRVIYFADHTAVQAAELLGLPVGTVKSRTHHALRRLKICIEEQMLCSEDQ